MHCVFRMTGEAISNSIPGSWYTKSHVLLYMQPWHSESNLSCLACANTSSVEWGVAFTVLDHSQIAKLVSFGQLTQPPEPKAVEKKGSCSGILHCDLLTARVAMSASIHEPICGSNHHPSTPKRADWKLIKNASARWMTGSFCWSSALKEEAGRSRVPGAAEPPVASAIVSLPGSCLISGSISMKPLSCLCKC